MDIDLKEDQETEKAGIFNSLSNNEEVFFKSQQLGESDLNQEEKAKIANDLYEKSKVNFLLRFGKHLRIEQLEHFQQFISEPSGELSILLANLVKSNSQQKQDQVKNRRYAALQELIKGEEYFSELEMMKRNPLLYDQLVGQYLTEEEVRERDKFQMNNETTFVKILMEGIERDNALAERRRQEIKEDETMEESDSDSESETCKIPEPGCSSSSKRWGEFEDLQMHRSTVKAKICNITLNERKLLREEFVSLMHQSFLEGKDVDFNYDSVDNNDGYDNADEMDHDAEDEYFDSEEPETVQINDGDKIESSEDELDIYMSALNNHPTVVQLSKEMKKL